MPGTLYVLGTPIGNISDITLRALDILSEVDFIAAEDTRVTLKLLNKYDIKKPLVSYHDHSSRLCAEGIISRLAAGENGAVVTDAGMPCISDPGENLVRICYEKNIDVKVVPGASAVVSALAISGLNTSRFTFEGFLSVTKKQRFEHLESLRDEKRTMIFYEAPHKLRNTLDDLYRTLGDRKIALCRELTKIHEEVIKGTLSEMIERYKEITPRGEYVLIVEGKQKSQENEEITLLDAALMAKELADSGTKPSDACRQIASKTPFSKSEIYKKYLEL